MTNNMLKVLKHLADGPLEWRPGFKSGNLHIDLPGLGRIHRMVLNRLETRGLLKQTWTPHDDGGVYTLRLELTEDD